MELKKRLTVYNYLMQKKLKKKLKRFGGKEIIKMKSDNDYDSHIIDDMPLTINREPKPGRFYPHEAH